MAVFEIGTRTVFNNNSAPTGWTKVTDFDDYALRVVSGTGGGTGGTVNFSQLHNIPVTITGNVTFSAYSSGATPMTSTQLPSHTHNHGNVRGPTIGSASRATTPAGGVLVFANYGSTASSTTMANGGGAPAAPTLVGHTHPIGGTELGLTGSSDLGFSVAYIDLIIASKD